MKSRKNSKTHNHLKQYLTAYHTVIFQPIRRSCHVFQKRCAEKKLNGLIQKCLLNGSNNPVLVPKLWNQDAQGWFLSNHTRVHMASNARNAVHGVRKSRNSKKHVEPSSLNTTIWEFDSQFACSFANCVIDVKTFVRNSTSQILVCQCVTSN